MIGVRQVRRQHSDRAQMHVAISEECQDDRKPASRTRGFDAIEGRVLREVKNMRAVCEHRRTPLTEVQPTRIQFTECGHQARDREALRSGEPRHFGEQFRIRKMFKSRL